MKAVVATFNFNQEGLSLLLYKFKLTNGVGHEAGGDGDGPAEQEGHGHVGLVAEQQGLQGVEQAEVHAAVDEDADGGDGEASVETLDAVRLEGLCVDINQTIELTLSALALGVIGQPGDNHHVTIVDHYSARQVKLLYPPGSGVVEGVDEHEGEGTGHAAARDVHAELVAVAGVLGHGEHGLDGILEGEVESLGGEVSQHVGQVS